MNRINRNIKDLIIIDNNAYCFKYNQENGLLIKDFINNKNDNELINSIPFLKHMEQVQDVRDIRKQLKRF